MASRAPERSFSCAANDAEPGDVEGAWFTAARLAELALPGLPADKRAINRRAQEERWASRTDRDGALLARPHAGRGGGIEYHLSLLPPNARLALSRMLRPDEAKPEDAPQDGGWRWLESQSRKVRADADKRLAAVIDVDALTKGGMTRTAAVAQVGGQRKIGKATLWNWLALVDGVPRANWLPALAPRRGGGGKQAEVDSGLWLALVSDYLRPERPSFASSYERIRTQYAEPRGLEMPNARTLRRKLEREVDPLVVISRREGAEALRRTLPPEERSVAGLHALELVNIDGHRWDVFVRWEDGTIGRPVMVAIQDVRSRKMLAWSIGRTESVIETRLALAHMLKEYGIPRGILMDNGRAFASKWISGGATSRFRFTIRDEEPLGILKALGIESHWAQPYRGQSKPIERGFRDLCDHVAKSPEFAGAYTGNRPDAKPENYGTAAVPIATFRDVVEAGIAAHNARPGRRTEMCKARGLSFDQAFAESYAAAPIGKATPEQLRLALLAADDRPIDRKSGAISLFGHRYWAAELSRIAGERVTVRFDPDDLHAPLHVYLRDGAYLCAAPLLEAGEFLDAAGAKRRAKLEKDLRKSVRAAEDAEALLDADRVASLLVRPHAPAPLPDAGATRPVRVRGNIAADLRARPRPEPVAVPNRETLLDQLASGHRLASGRHLKSVK